MAKPLRVMFDRELLEFRSLRWSPSTRCRRCRPRSSSTRHHKRNGSPAQLWAESVDTAIDLAHSFLRLANLPSFPLDRLSRCEAILWRQASQIPFALDALDRRKPQKRFNIGSWRNSASVVPD
jgi:hypothetical protein